jgi:hypothetical protein
MSRGRTALFIGAIAVALCGLVVHRIGALLTTSNDSASVTYPGQGQVLANMTPNPFFVRSSHSVTFTKSGMTTDVGGFRFTNGHKPQFEAENQLGIATGGHTWPYYETGSITYSVPSLTGYYDTGLVEGYYNAFARTYASINGTETLLRQDYPGFSVDP